MAADAAGHVFVTGAFSFSVDFDPGPGEAVRTTDGFGDAFVASYDAGGAFRWVFTRPREGEHSIGRGIAHAPPGDVVVAGRFRLTTDFDPDPDEEFTFGSACGDGSGFVARYRDTGDGADFRWAFPLGGCQEDDFVPGMNVAHGVAVTPKDEVLVAGGFRGTADFDPGPDEAVIAARLGTAIFLAKYGADGAYRWALEVDSEEGSIDTGEALAVAAGADGGAVMTGIFVLPADFDPDPAVEHMLTPIGGVGDNDAFVASYDAEGRLRWAHVLGTPDERFPDGRSVTLDGEGNVLVTGTGLSFASYTAEGVLRWSFYLRGTEGSGTAYGTALLPEDRFAAVGEFNGTVDFDPGPAEHLLVAAGPDPLIWADLFVASYEDGGGFPVAAEVGVPEASPRLAVAPNPSRGRARVTVAVPSPQRVRVATYDVLGRRVAVLHEGAASAGPLHLGLDAAELPSGVYVVRAVGETFTASQTVTRLR